MRGVTREEARAAAAAYGEAWATGVRIKACLTEDVVLVERQYAEGGTFHSLEEVEEYWLEGVMSRRVVSFELVDVLVDDDVDKAVAKWEIKMLVLLETDEWKPISLVQVAVLTFRRDEGAGVYKVCRSEEYWQNVPPPAPKAKTPEQKEAMLQRQQRHHERMLEFQKHLNTQSLSEYSMN
eukprot:TRINITY_DN1161_c0_g1_i1.p1 TRINITY_DN1161_c0_g1~~TRINITY_DN1161_c0_g1_i1.p1  ORF type:complete len:180 (+),score=67.69 TRINITY_DN1161_c0_g1_i1:230-769(+)